ncbi:hypothetical protein NP233_g10238 [Leucocoprinus birnbaumii]|uniref:NAD-dependent epimerase/dehydratase domain-containing protein n=1 Tax=Leucocoprinus birnbaumii TaxID=56174 RepID=A0AAD5VLB5_9AGAR|nr:hypothetical protein NP233_g10238 [Leucocoprinus birnbaumii]
MGIAIPPSKILITGANGYIAAWVVDTLLKTGYTVRGCVRSQDRAKDLEKIFPQFVADGKLEFAIVGDISRASVSISETIDRLSVLSSQEGAFDAAVTDVDGIIHMASPVVLDADDPQELIAPAIAGTVSILRSASKERSLKRIVFTSSTAAVMVPVSEPTTFNESDWNTVSVEAVERLGKQALPMHKYRASKTLAERAIWKYLEEHKDTVPWDVVTINPPFVFGPALNDFKGPSQQNATTKMWWDFVIANPPSKISVTTFNSYVDVRDVALAHVLALQKPEAGGQRIIVSAGAFVWQDWFDIVYTYRSPLKVHIYPHHQESDGFLPRGLPEVERNRLLAYDNSKSLRILGPELQYRSMKETAEDILADCSARGW